ncbi:YbaK/EbsC family protein [Spongiactinospora sp. TRM90649]|uniref:YbaK/EbsC family protein n=1 Tax=Spongiactinospora sp. TRM90649 TaxID=3031114 RepID=UPI0023F6F5E5|nr:YbaK/EbsC family protein [Spongiactinospora sp. TRM90649]MDF5757038.1 YbaK/EbsC family protein [Spongiactinospora sp. TRM90649]
MLFLAIGDATGDAGADPDGDPDALPPREARVLWPPGERPRGPAVPAVPPALARELAEAEACVRVGAYAMALVNVRRLLEGVCADHGIGERPLYRALRVLRGRGLVEGRLAAWAEELREVGNEAAHISGRPVEREDAEDAIVLAEALLDHLYLVNRRYAAFRARRGPLAVRGAPIRETPAMKLLRKCRVPFTAHQHKHDPGRAKSRRRLAAELGVPVPRVLKAVIANVDGRPVAAVAPAVLDIDLPALARAAGGRAIRLAAPAEVSRLGWATASEVVSPLALPYLPSVVDEAVGGLPSVYVSSGRHGLELELDPADLIRVTGATTGPITVR